MIDENEVFLTNATCDEYGFAYGQKGLIVGKCCGDDNCFYKKVKVDDMVFDLEPSEYMPAKFPHTLKQHPLTKIFQ